jgi:hypothetical protein
MICAFRYLKDKNLSRAITFDENTDLTNWPAFSFSEIFACFEIQWMWNWTLCNFSVVSQISFARKCLEFSTLWIAFWLFVKFYICVEFRNVLDHFVVFLIAYNLASSMFISIFKFHVLYATSKLWYRTHNAIDIFVFESCAVSV